MPRIPRRELPTPAWYHVISRGVEKRRIVLDDLDREAWFKLFDRVAREYTWNVVSWCLLDNHFHILVHTTQPQLSAGMQRLNGLHAIRFNRRYDRPRRPSLPGPLREPCRRGRRVLRGRRPVHLRQLHPRRPARLAMARRRVRPVATGLCFEEA